MLTILRNPFTELAAMERNVDRIFSEVWRLTATKLRQMAMNPAAFGFSTEYRGEPTAYDAFDEYLRIEFPKRHPGWDPRFGQASWFDPAKNRYDYMYLISGNVPDAQSQADAEHKVTKLLDEIARGFKAVGPDIKKALPKPITKVWHWHP